MRCSRAASWRRENFCGGNPLFILIIYAISERAVCLLGLPGCCRVLVRRREYRGHGFVSRKVFCVEERYVWFAGKVCGAACAGLQGQERREPEKRRTGWVSSGQSGGAKRGVENDLSALWRLLVDEKGVERRKVWSFVETTKVLSCACNHAGTN